MNPTQSNTQAGKIVRVASVALTGLEGYLAKLVNSSGANVVALPTAITDRTNFIIDNGGASGDEVTIDPLEPGRQYRVKAKGAGACGALLCLAAIAGADAGKVRAVPAGAGTYHAILVAEETFVDGQFVLCRPISREAIVVS